jgi:hypothetical protein
MVHDEFIKEFLKTFPEFSTIAEREFSCWYGSQPPLHIFFSSVLDPFLVKELDCITDPIFLTRIFNYLEKLAGSDVKGVREALISTFVWLGCDKGLLANAQAFMGPKTLRLSYEVERNWITNTKV